jgi:hypothetical protein
MCGEPYVLPMYLLLEFAFYVLCICLLPSPVFQIPAFNVNHGTNEFSVCIQQYSSFFVVSVIL